MDWADVHKAETSEDIVDVKVVQQNCIGIASHYDHNKHVSLDC